MGAVRVKVSFELLREVLGFPPGTIIKFAETEADGFERDMVMTLTHPDIPAAPMGGLPPLACPTFRKQEPVVFVDWGIC
jgi:hypothetical protein